MCVDAAVRGGIEQSKAIMGFGEWQAKLHPEIRNEELARGWMSQMGVLAF